MSFEEAVTRCGTNEALGKAVSDGRVISEGGHVNWLKNVYKFPIFKLLTKDYCAACEVKWRRLKRQKLTVHQMELINKTGGRLAMESNGSHGSVLTVRPPIDHLANTHRTSKKRDVKSKIERARIQHTVWHFLILSENQRIDLSIYLSIDRSI